MTNETSGDKWDGQGWDPRRKDYQDPIRPHPMFPLPEDQPNETRRIYYIHIWRKNEQSGIAERCPKRFTAEETREKGWEPLIAKWGRGFYKAEAMTSMCVKQGYSRGGLDGGEWEYFAGPPPKPFFPEDELPATTSTGAQQAGMQTYGQSAVQLAPSSAGPASMTGSGMDWLGFLNAERDRADRAIARAEQQTEAERERNARLLEKMVAERTGTAASSVKEVLDLARSLPRSGGLSELRENLDFLERLGLGIRRETAAPDAEIGMAKELMTTVQSVISGAQTAAAPPPQAPTPPAEAPKVKLVVPGIGDVEVHEERMKGLIAARGVSIASSPPGAAVTQPASQASGRGSPSPPPVASPAPTQAPEPPVSAPVAASAPMAPPPAAAGRQRRKGEGSAGRHQRREELTVLLEQITHLQTRLVALLETDEQPVPTKSPSTAGFTPPLRPTSPVPRGAPSPTTTAVSPAPPYAPDPQAPPPSSAPSPSTGNVSRPFVQAAPSPAPAAATSNHPAPSCSPPPPVASNPDLPLPPDAPPGSTVEPNAARASPADAEPDPWRDRTPIITPPPAGLNLPSDDEIARILADPLVRDVLPPDLRNHSAEIIEEIRRRKTRNEAG